MYLLSITPILFLCMFFLARIDPTHQIYMNSVFPFSCFMYILIALYINAVWNSKLQSDKGDTHIHTETDRDRERLNVNMK